MGHISDLDGSKPLGSEDANLTDNYLRDINLALKTDFANISGAVTANHTDLNRCDITTEGVANVGEVVTVAAAGGINLNNQALTNANIDGGDLDGGNIDGAAIGANSACTINDSIIGGTTPAAGTFLALVGTVVQASTSLQIASSTAITGIENTLVGGADDLVRADGIKAAVDAVEAAIPTIYTGDVASNGVANDLPATWTSDSSSSPYTITHGLNTTEYDVVGSAVRSDNNTRNVQITKNLNTMVVRVTNKDNSYSDSGFNFIMVMR